MIRFITWQSAFLAAALFVLPARAEPSEADRATARELAAAGYHALKRGDYAVAVDHFRRADTLVHAPTLVVDWARALTGLGLLVEAGEKYELVIREGVEPAAPSSWHRAHAEARGELEALRPRLAWLTLIVSGPDTPVITVDRIRLPDEVLGAPRAANPGTHVIRVGASGYVPEVRSVTLVEGARERVEIELQPRPPDSLPTAKPERPAEQPLEPPPQPGDSGTRRGFAYAAFAVGGAGLVVGGVTGGMALHRRSELESVCSGGTCPPSERDAIETYHALGVASGIGFGVAVLGIGTGITLLLTEPNEGPRDSARKQRTGLAPYVGLGTVGVSGRY